jgi:oxalyl-CoA decarboxylase
VVFNNNGIYRGTDVNPAGTEPAWTTFVKDSHYELMAQAFGGRGVRVTSPDELSRAVREAMDAGVPTLINAIIDEKAGTESGRIGNLNPQSAVAKAAPKT